MAATGQISNLPMLSSNIMYDEGDNLLVHDLSGAWIPCSDFPKT